MQQIIGQEGRRYLISLDGDWEEAMAKDRPMAQIADLDSGLLYPPTNLHSIMAHTHGSWQRIEGTSRELDRVLSKVGATPPGERRERPEQRAGRRRSAPAGDSRK